MANSDCVRTFVRNATTKTLFFGFLGPRGKSLAPGEEYSAVGGIESLLTRNDDRTRKFFEDALNGGYLDLVRTPAPHFFDQTSNQTKILEIDNGVVQVEDPCWGAFSSASGTP